MKVGDLVLPVNDDEFLFTKAHNMDPASDDIEIVWREVPGIILELSDFCPKREYQRVRVIVANVIGWTYSDYIRSIV